MALGDHRYAQPRWAKVLSAVLQTPHRRIGLVKNPEWAAEHWGFCEGGQATLRILNVLYEQHGEDAIQAGADRFLALYEAHPDLMVQVVGSIAGSMTKRETAEVLNMLATAMGYREAT